MTTAITKMKLSGSTDGMPIKVAATATLGTTIHTADATALDEIWLWAVNTDSSARLLTLEFGDVTSPDHHVAKTISAQGTEGVDGPVLILPGVLLTNSKVLTAFAASANKINLFGFINRIVQS